MLNLDGLRNLTRITWSELDIQENQSLLHLYGLGKLEHVERHLRIRDNPSLSSLNGLSALTHVGETIQISNNAALETAAVQKLVDRLVNGGFDGEVIYHRLRLDRRSKPAPPPGSRTFLHA